MRQALLRQLPSVDRLAGEPAVAAWPRALVLRAARTVLDHTRAELLAGRRDTLPDLVAALCAELAQLEGMRLRRVINATGIVLHTNLGRAPLAPEAVAAIQEVARGYSNTELRLDSGQRGGRLEGVLGPLRALTGCEDALVVNNNAAAVVLVLTALAQGREVVVSRGELVEIGGSFRVPDIMAVSGAILREVGTTNRTRAADYAAALGPQTALLMRVHPSNFKVIGFTERPTVAELAALGPPVVDDLGSGALLPGLGEEPVVAEVLRQGAALVCFSGDKLVGGPQAGFVLGRAELVARCRKHPLYRALRVDKLVLAGIEATLRLALRGDPDAVPALRLLRRDPIPAAERLAEALRGALAGQGVQIALEDDVAFSGGGALPGEPLPGRVVALRGPDPLALAAALRAGEPPVVARVAREALCLDARTLLTTGEEVELVQAVAAALTRLSCRA